ncbi:MAG: hypothetical protein FD122_2360 [Stygiobacter sp.]|nr:MAG: hypothetical protein FD122_2360 [Stygiobacter sp.]
MNSLLAPLFSIFLLLFVLLLCIRLVLGKNIYERFMGHWLFYISKSMVHSIFRMIRKFSRFVFSLFTKVDSMFK